MTGVSVERLREKWVSLDSFPVWFWDFTSDSLGSSSQEVHHSTNFWRYDKFLSLSEEDNTGLAQSLCVCNPLDGNLYPSCICTLSNNKKSWSPLNWSFIIFIYSISSLLRIVTVWRRNALKILEKIRKDGRISIHISGNSGIVCINFLQKLTVEMFYAYRCCRSWFKICPRFFFTLQKLSCRILWKEECRNIVFSFVLFDLQSGTQQRWGIFLRFN